MLLGLISVVVLVLLGMLNANAFVSAKHPKLKELVDKTTPFENYLGLAGIVLGLIEIFNSLSYFHGLLGLVGLVTGIITLSLGLLSSARFLKEQVFKNNASLQSKVDLCVAKLAVQQQNLGVSGIVLGIVYLLMMLGAY